MGIAGLMIRRKLVREFPLFFIYVLFQAGRAGLLFLLEGRYAPYFYAYWVGQALSAGLGLAVVYELFSYVLRPYEAIRDLGAMLFRWALLILLGVAVVMASASPGTDTVRIVAGVLLAERSAEVVRVGLLLFLFLFASYLGLKWRDYAFGISLGFGLYGSVALAAVAMRGHAGSVATSVVSLVNSLAYTCALLVWVSYLLRPVAEAQPAARVPKHDLEKWNQALLEILQQ